MEEQTKDDSTTQPTVPEELNSASSKLVYLYIRSNELPTLAEISSALHMKKLTLFAVLETLQKDGFIEKNGSQYSHAM